MFHQVFVERAVQQHPQTEKILAALGQPPVRVLTKIEDVFGRTVKPYLQKRTTLNLFIGRKHGQLVKRTPPAYGTSTGQHYFFYNSYNCIMECEYCYLQGYFNSPDLVFYVNHDEICAAIKNICQAAPDEQHWFHGGEFSDSLALSHLTQELSWYWQTFAALDNGFLELRTKSVNIKELLRLPPLPNVVVSFSLAPPTQVSTFEHKTAAARLRLNAISKLAAHGYRIGIHLDPIIYHPQVVDTYRPLVHEVRQRLDDAQFAYLSLGVVRFSREVFSRFKKNYPTSKLLAENFSCRSDGKISYFRPQRLALLRRMRALCLEVGLPAARVYFCMED